MFGTQWFWFGSGQSAFSKQRSGNAQILAAIRTYIEKLRPAVVREHSTRMR